MYLHLGQNVVIPVKKIIGLFDLDNTSQSKTTRQFLEKAEKENRVINISDDIPKSFAVCMDKGECKIYISQLSTATLLKRSESINSMLI